MDIESLLMLCLYILMILTGYVIGHCLKKKNKNIKWVYRLQTAAIIAMVVSFFTPLIQGIYAIPLPVIGGLEIYLFGAIAAQGVAIMIDKKVDMFSAKNIAVIASIMVIGIGGQYAFGGNIDFFGINVPCIAGAAIFGILLNLLLSIGEKKKDAEVQEAKEA